ncbi:DUF4405 domain-containing protein [Heliobacterium gestii]|uniref:DUF4405 domain-containing protein n=1 Tax=Heliomicrobium gestii TaxID=2699 RepID=A0A845LLD5_HELGE|nr:DUF4405 domain-containing protein [Heliomicrobium gestii]MBM7867391.1 ABC-type multidrug transport system permease subunit [Heliomicrobium gestii]MZP43656.1 DUF4405 domain-containing protein [Heliomicrobium gestii]
MSSITNSSMPHVSTDCKIATRSSVGKVKGILSTALALLGLIVTVTGVGLFVAPHGPSAAKGWTFLGMNVPAMKGLHIWLGFGMVAFVLGHFALNLKTLMAELKQVFR